MAENAGNFRAAVACVLATLLIASACGSTDHKSAPGHAVAAAGAAGVPDEAGGSSAGGAAPGPDAGAGGAGAGRADEGGMGGDLGVPGGNPADAGAAGQGPSHVVNGTPCAGNEPFCLDRDTVAACGNDGVQRAFDCTNGCAQNACQQTNLVSDWVLYNFTVPDDSPQVTADYSFSTDQLSALETENALPSVYYYDHVLQNVDITGSFAVETSSDDDFIGFVFGWQDPSHFYLFDWKKAAQVDSSCGTANTGAALKVAASDAPLSTCQDYWNSAGTAAVKPLVNTDANPNGWVENTVYTFHLIYKPGDIKIEVRNGQTLVATITSNDATYPSGKFGFYAYSQAASRFQFFQVGPAL